MVLSTATAGNLRDVDFLPLTVDVEERMYAAGKIPGSFFRREGRSGEKGTLTARMIDRPLRPLFPKGWRRETQLVSIPMSIDHVNPYDILAMNGASAALMVSDIPFPFAGRRRAHRPGRGGQLRREPRRGVDAREPARPRGLGHRGGHPHGRGRRQRDLRGRDPRRARHRPRRDQEALRRPARAGREGRQAEDEVEVPQVDERHPGRADRAVRRRSSREATQVVDKLERQDATKAVEEEAVEASRRRPRGRRGLQREARRGADAPSTSSRRTPSASASPSRRSAPTAAPPTRSATSGSRSAWRPRTHGSAVFTRGQTQAFSVAALGTTRDEMRLDTLGLETTKRYWHHYNFPPFSVGEAGFMRGPKRRDIGHGALAERALVPVVPDPEEFPYSIRVVSDILESNGSSSMASVCGSSLALMDAGRADQAPGGRHRDGPDQGGRRLHRALRHRGRGGPPRRHGLQGRRHLAGHHRPADGHQDHGRDLRHPA